MKKTLRSYLISILICVFAVVFALGVMTACGDSGSGENNGDNSGTQQGGSGNEGEGSGSEGEGGGGEGGDVTETTYKVTLSLDGGALETTEFSLKEGEDLYAALQAYVPTKDGYLFGKWTLGGADVTEGAKMPAADTTLTAVWKSPVSVTVYKLDFEHYDVYDEGTATTVYAYAGETLTVDSYVPEHYELNEELTETLSVTVPETTDATLSLYVDPLYTRYLDVFDSSDYLYELEAEEGVLYLDRVEMAEGRKKSTSYDKTTGAFSFKTGEEEDSFVLEGVISGDRFYYYRDTINQTFADYLDTDAVLTIESKDKVTYTPAGGQPQTGKYTVDVARGVYVFAPETGEPVEFVLIEYAGILYFRMHDGVEGWYAYDGELYGGGWALLHFDGFGVATYVDDETGSDDYYGEESGPIEYEYVYEGNGIINVYELGVIKVTDGTHDPVGGYEVSGTFINSDGLEGDYYHVNGRRTEVLTLNGFGGASFYAYTEDGPVEDSETSGTYTVEADETWLTEVYDSYYGMYLVDEYAYVNEYLVYTTSTGSTTYLLSEETDDYGDTTLSFEEYKSDLYDVVPGVHKVTNSFSCMGREYTVDATEQGPKAFLYFYTDETVSLWYGEYDADEEDFIYEQLVYGDWYGSYDGSGELYNLDLEYDGMYFKEMAEDGSFEYDHEVWDGETDPYDYVFYSGDDGKLAMDSEGDVYWVPAEGDRALVDYEIVAQGLIFVFEFDFTGANVPETVSTLWAFYDGYYDYRAEETTEVFYDLKASATHVYSFDAEPADGEIASIIVTSDLTFVGFWFEYTDGSMGVEYLYAGDTAPVQESQEEFTFAWNEDIYYDDLDLLEYFYDVADFHNFYYKVDGDKFIYGDGVKLSLTNEAGDTLTTDGFGTATLTENDESVTGTYEVEYDVLVFLPDGIEDLPDEEYYDSIRYFQFADGTFVEIDSETLEGLFEGYYIGAILDENGDIYDYTDDGLFLNGVGGFTYEVYVYSDEDYDFVLETKTGTYEVIDFDQPMGGLVYIRATVAFTFEDKTTAEGVILLYDYYEDGGIYPFFAMRNDALMGDYIAYTDDGEQLGMLIGGDGYYEYGATFEGEDENGPFSYKGYMARGFIDDQYYNSVPQFTADKDGDVIVFDTTDEYGYQLQFVFDIDEDAETEGAVVYRDKFYGTVAEYQVQGGTTGNYLYLDGHSTATLYDDQDAVVKEGTYEFVDTMEDVYAFKNDKGEVEFLFSVSMISYGSQGVLYYYVQYVEKEDVLLVNDDWSIFYMDGFGNVTYIDPYGVAYGGECYKATDDYDVYCLKVASSTKRIYFELDFEHKKFTVMGGEEFLVRGGVLLLYFGTDESITIPDEVTRIAEGAFVLDGALNIKHINFNNVKTIDANAFYYATSLEELSSDKIESIGASAFEHLWSLTKVNLPNCTTIGEKAFFDCVYLAEVKLGKIENIGAYAFTRSIALDPATFTLDLTAVADFSGLTIDFTAFIAKRGSFGIVNQTIFIEGSKVLVGGGVDGLNAAANKLKGKTGSISYHDMSGDASAPNKEGEVDVDLTPYLALPAAENDPASGLAFYDLKTDAVLVFDGGVATVYAGSGYSYELSKSYPYYIDKDGKVVLFSKDESGAYKADLTLDVKSATSVTLENVQYIKSEEAATTSATVNGKNVVITYEASVSTSYGVSVTLDVTAVTYDEKPVENFTFSSFDGTLEFNADNHGFEAKLADGVFTVTDLGLEYVLEDESQSVWFRLTVGISDDNKATLKKLEYNPSGESGSYYEAYYGYTETADNTWSYTTNYVRYTLKVTVPAQGGEPTLSVTNDGYVIEKDGFVITLKVNEDFTQIEQIIEIKQNNVAIDISKISYNEGKTSATLTVENDGTYIIAIAPSQYAPNFTLTITHTDYDTTKSGMVLDGDDFYWVELNVHFDAEGKATIKGITRFEDFMTDTPIPYTTATPNDDGSLTVALQDGRTAKFTIEGDSITIAWVEA